MSQVINLNITVNLTVEIPEERLEQLKDNSIEVNDCIYLSDIVYIKDVKSEDVYKVLSQETMYTELVLDDEQ